MIEIEQTAKAFEKAFGSTPKLYTQAPGRINLIGEHVDYAGGQVMPMAISRGVTIAAAPGKTSRVRVHSDKYLDAGVAEFDPAEQAPPEFLSFIHALALETITVGADIAVCSDLPIERGWSSSAAFSVALMSALVAIENNRIRPNPLDLCQAAQRAEATALGVNCGLMDQYVSFYGKRESAVMFDTYKLSHEYVPLNLGNAVIIMVDSGQPRRLAESGYTERRQELETGFRELKRIIGEFESFRERDSHELLSRLDEVRSPYRYRVRHVITEHQRVGEARTAIEQSDLIRFGQILDSSHNSLSSNYAVSTPELDSLAGLLTNIPGVYGARLVGGGFGGGMLALADRKVLPHGLDDALARYSAQTGLKATWEEAVTSDGAVIVFDGAEPRLVREWL